MKIYITKEGLIQKKNVSCAMTFKTFQNYILDLQSIITMMKKPSSF
jgi:hypothetical protein